MGIKKKHVPGCGCCGASVPPTFVCCTPSVSTITVVVSGVNAEHTPPCPECSDMNGTYVCSTISPCDWVSPQNADGFSVWLMVTNQGGRGYKVRIQWFGAIMVEAFVLSATECNVLSSFVIELLGDQTYTNGCCSYASGSEAALTA